ncbi:MAG: nicotinamide-nucleotide amidohydrolase family protein, partial [Chlamydiales bacterium]|nr:nicotinamide-nucleotide amidohydrolase family protein [Chlamydiales bacterium]
NSNASFLSAHLTENGYQVVRQIALPDDPSLLQEGLEEIFRRRSLVITTGGLGPTCDDKTREIIAHLFSTDLIYREEVADDLKKRFGETLLSLKDQATIPESAKPILNRLGTAPGLLLSKEGKTWILLPGVPQEMQEMFLQDLLPYLLKNHPPLHKKRSIKLYFSVLNESQIDPVLRLLKEEHPQVDIGIYPSYGALMLHLASADSAHLEMCRKTLAERFEPYLFDAPNGKIEEAIHAWFIANGKKLALAESCTGGAIAASLTAIPGASLYFLGSIVAYSNAMKQEILEVSHATLEKAGAVSQEAVLEMLQGVFAKTDADYAISISGIAGPDGGTAQKPVGTMWAAIGKRGEKPDVGTFFLRGNRQTRPLSAKSLLLGALYRKVTRGAPAFPLPLP